MSKTSYIEDKELVRRISIISSRLQYMDLVLVGYDPSIFYFDPSTKGTGDFTKCQWAKIEELIIKAYPEAQDEGLMVKKYKEYKKQVVVELQTAREIEKLFSDFEGEPVIAADYFVKIGRIHAENRESFEDVISTDGSFSYFIEVDENDVVALNLAQDPVEFFEEACNLLLNDVYGNDLQATDNFYEAIVLKLDKGYELTGTTTGWAIKSKRPELWKVVNGVLGKWKVKMEERK